MDSWKKYCPDYNIIQWNENNFDVSINTYCYEAYKSKKWAFVSDYARLKILYIHGGIYLDTDVELLKPLDPLLKNNKAWIGFQNTEQITTGLGFASEPYNPCIEEMLKLYEKIHFIKPDRNFDLTPFALNTYWRYKGCRENGDKIYNFITWDSTKSLKAISLYGILTGITGLFIAFHN